VFAAGDVAGPVLPGHDGPLRLAVQFSIAGGRCAARNVLRSTTGEPQRPFRAKDLGYVVPLAPGQAAGVVLGLEMVGRAPSLLHYMMCAARSWAWSDRVGILVDLLRRGEAG
jgi:NADH dehydrogenase FAD-containing subunit